MWFTKAKRAQTNEDDETWIEGGMCPTLNVMDNTSEAYATAVRVDGLRVRRLTPVECERLQGFPDDWTDGQTDGHRYRQLGNAVTVPVAEWIGRRLVEVDADVS